MEILPSLLTVALRSTNVSKKTPFPASPNRGYYYAIVFHPGRGVAQWSSPFFADCAVSKIMSRIDRYGESNNFNNSRLVGPFENESELLTHKNYVKRQFQASGFAVGGDNNYVGDCY